MDKQEENEVYGSARNAINIHLLSAKNSAIEYDHRSTSYICRVIPPAFIWIEIKLIRLAMLVVFSPTILS